MLLFISSARIEVSREESESHWQKNDYKSFSPSADWDKVDFAKAPAIQELPVSSVICDPQHDDTVTLDNEGHLTLRGNVFIFIKHSSWFKI